MHLLVAIEMDRPVEALVRLVLIDLLVEQQGVGADGDIFAFFQSAFDDFRQLFVQQWLATGQHHDRRAAFIHRMESVGDRDALVQDLVWIIDLAAASARQVTAKQRLEHEHERITLHALEVLSDDIRADRQGLRQWDTQDRAPYKGWVRLFEPDTMKGVLGDHELLR